MIRDARGDELPHLQHVELAAGSRFRDVGMHAVADNDPAHLDHLRTRLRSGQLWVYADGDDRVAGFLLLDVVDGYGHVEEVAVLPSHGGQGIGRLLIDTADRWAQRHGLAGLTLTTFTGVPWNAPYYERLGFRCLQPSDLSEGLRAIRCDERAQGLDRWPRVAMRRQNTGAPPA